MIHILLKSYHLSCFSYLVSKKDNHLSDKNAGKKIKEDKNPIHSKYSKLNDKHDNDNQLVKIGQELEEILLNPLTTQESIKQFHRLKYEEKIRKHFQSMKYF